MSFVCSTGARATFVVQLNKRAEKGLRKSLPRHGEQMLELVSALKVDPIPYRVYARAPGIFR